MYNIVKKIQNFSFGNGRLIVDVFCYFRNNLSNNLSAWILNTVEIELTKILYVSLYTKITITFFIG